MDKDKIQWLASFGIQRAFMQTVKDYEAGKPQILAFVDAETVQLLKKASDQDQWACLIVAFNIFIKDLMSSGRQVVIVKEGDVATGEHIASIVHPDIKLVAAEDYHPDKVKKEEVRH